MAFLNRDHIIKMLKDYWTSNGKLKFQPADGFGPVFYDVVRRQYSVAKENVRSLDW